MNHNIISIIISNINIEDFTPDLPFNNIKEILNPINNDDIMRKNVIASFEIEYQLNKEKKNNDTKTEQNYFPYRWRCELFIFFSF